MCVIRTSNNNSSDTCPSPLCVVSTSAENNNRHGCVWYGKLFFRVPAGWIYVTLPSLGLSMTTQGWMPAGSWTGWWWRTWTGPTCASILPATTGWVGRRLITCMSETCWAAWISWMSQNVGHAETNMQHKSDKKIPKGHNRIKAESIFFFFKTTSSLQLCLKTVLNTTSETV